MFKNNNPSIFVLLPLFFAFSLVMVLLSLPGAASRAMTTESANLSEPFQALQNGTYVIVARHSQKALDIPAFSTTEGTGLTQYERNNGNNQQFILTRQPDGTYTITVKHSGLVLDVLGASMEDGAIVAQWTSNNGLNQRWRIEPTDSGYYRVISVNSNKALDVAGVSQENGAALIQWENTGNGNQQFFFDLVAPTPTPLNGKIAFTSDRNGNRDIYTIKPDGTNELTDPQCASFYSQPLAAVNVES